MPYGIRPLKKQAARKHGRLEQTLEFFELIGLAFAAWFIYMCAAAL